MKSRILHSAQSIFQKASTTYYYSTIFFPKNVRDDVTYFYAFVRIADDYVDAVPQDNSGFKKFCDLYWRYRTDRDELNLRRNAGNTIESFVIDSIRMMVILQDKYSIPNSLIDSFLVAMKADLTKKEYKTIEETIEYMYGSAEVIGLVMSLRLGLPAASRQAAQLQGRAMQYINFIRDITEDNSLGRQYIPTEELKKYGLADLSFDTAQKQPKDFTDCVHAQITTYKKWQAQAAKGYVYIPYRYRVPIMTAAWMYNWTAKTIAKDPHIVFKRKVKPNKFLVVMIGILIAIQQLSKPIVENST